MLRGHYVHLVVSRLVGIQIVKERYIVLLSEFTSYHFLFRRVKRYVD
ncbi:hypothetical protein 14Stepyanka_00050 [Erwinia phage Stepyanka]|uniref:Uncharacterized protein n=1 Tax=Erwinia phage Stepyanka TaxID=2961688 RepID=A0A9E7NQ16_9CAUD|nr:hypothetical protein 14Stepyanka_00050 [Erwinia phage Stepyanka]